MRIKKFTWFDILRILRGMSSPELEPDALEYSKEYVALLYVCFTSLNMLLVIPPPALISYNLEDQYRSILGFFPEMIKQMGKLWVHIGKKLLGR